MNGEGGYLAQIQKEKDEIDRSIHSLLEIKEIFKTLCSQRCDDVFTDLKKLHELSLLSKYSI